MLPPPAERQISGTRRWIRISVALAIVSAALMPARIARACSMCQCGDATYRLLGVQMFGDRAWRASLEAEHLGKDQVSETDPTARETETQNRVTLAGAWSPLPSVRLLARVPFATHVIESPEGRSTMTGLGDPELIAHFRVLARGADWLSVSGGVKTAWGQNDREQGGERAEEHLQPGTGAVSLTAGLAASVVQGAAAHVFASLGGRWNQRNAAGYRYGDVLVANVAYQRPWSDRLSACGEFNFRFAAKDVNGSAYDPNTGGSVLYLSPKLLFKLSGPAVLQLGLQFPVFQNLYGDQNEHVNIQSGVVIAL
jgi:hypothetical protein